MHQHAYVLMYVGVCSLFSPEKYNGSPSILRKRKRLADNFDQAVSPERPQP